LRQKRLSANRGGDSSFSSASSSTAAASKGAAGDYSSTVVAASSPNATALSTVYLYGAVVLLVLGVIIGKWIL